MLQHPVEVFLEEAWTALRGFQGENLGVQVHVDVDRWSLTLSGDGPPPESLGLKFLPSAPSMECLPALEEGGAVFAKYANEVNGLAAHLWRIKHQRPFQEGIHPDSSQRLEILKGLDPNEVESHARKGNSLYGKFKVGPVLWTTLSYLIHNASPANAEFFFEALAGRVEEERTPKPVADLRKTLLANANRNPESPRYLSGRAVAAAVFLSWRAFMLGEGKASRWNPGGAKPDAFPELWTDEDQS
jgi:hypothetical protein